MTLASLIGEPTDPALIEHLEKTQTPKMGEGSFVYLRNQLKLWDCGRGPVPPPPAWFNPPAGNDILMDAVGAFFGFKSSLVPPNPSLMLEQQQRDYLIHMLRVAERDYQRGELKDIDLQALTC